MCVLGKVPEKGSSATAEKCPERGQMWGMIYGCCGCNQVARVPQCFHSAALANFIIFADVFWGVLVLYMPSKNNNGTSFEGDGGSYGSWNETVIHGLKLCTGSIFIFNSCAIKQKDKKLFPTTRLFYELVCTEIHRNTFLWLPLGKDVANLLCIHLSRERSFAQGLHGRR